MKVSREDFFILDASIYCLFVCSAAIVLVYVREVKSLQG